MKPIISSAFNMDTACVELRFLDGTMLTIDTIAVEYAVAANMFERSELDFLVYNDPIGYADLILKRRSEGVSAASNGLSLYGQRTTEYEHTAAL